VLEEAIGPGVAEALARTAAQVQEDAAALDALAAELAPDLAELAEGGIALPVAALAANPRAIVHRLIRLAVEDEFGTTLSRAQTLAVARLVFDWHGQEGVDLPGVTVVRAGGRLEFTGA
jgi:tRNA(Ile)-lysidine synthase